MTIFFDLVTLIASIKDVEQLEDFLMGLTTDKEREVFLQRVEIVKRLLAGEPQAKIAHELGVGVATVTRGSKELARGHFKVLRDNHESL